MRNFVITLLIIVPFWSSSQGFCKIPFEIEELSSSERLPEGLFIHYRANNFLISGVIETCSGKMQLEIFSKNDTILLAKGGYVESLDTLKEQIKEVDIENFSEKTIVREYFKPLKHGEWLFYDKKGNLLRKEIYKRGIKIN